MQHSFKRILLIRTDRLGDVVLTLPMLFWLRQTYPDVSCSMLLRDYTGEIVRGNTLVDQILWYDEKGKVIPFWTMLAALRRQRFDAVLLVHPTLRLALLAWMARIPVRVGSGYRYYSLLFNQRVFEHRKDAKRHELEYNLQLLRKLGCDPPSHVENPEFGIAISPESERRVDALLAEAQILSAEELVILHPSSGGSAREWPEDKFGELATLLIEKRGSRVVVTGGPGDRALADRLVQRSGGRAETFAGKLQLQELAALIRKATLFVSNSTGPLHLAVALGTPVLAFYPQITPMSAQRWGPYTSKRRVLIPDKPITCQDCSGRRGDPCACMDSISVARAFEAAGELLDERRISPVRRAEHE